MGNELRWRYECDRSCCASFTGKSGRPIRNKVAAYGTWHGLCFGAAVFVKLFKVSSIRLRLILVLGMIALVGSSLAGRSEEHTSELQSLMRISYAVFCLTKKNHTNKYNTQRHT